jgi:2-polyprenyl-6-methoxyphenol hydroxylase-like FAD-dependent oxidoreductase
VACWEELLAVELAADQPVDQALSRYAQRRRPVRRVQDAADRLAQASRLCNPVLRRLRDAALPGVGRAQGWINRQGRFLQQEDPAWLYTAVRTLLDGGPLAGTAPSGQ